MDIVDSVADDHLLYYVLCQFDGVDGTNRLVGVEYDDMIRQREYLLGGVTDSRYTAHLSSSSTLSLIYLGSKSLSTS